MTASIPAAATLALRTYLTCEFATIAKDGTPIAWPVAALFQLETATVLVSTTIGFPQKAFNVRRDPRVALLYSDPTGSGGETTDHVLLQGTALCTDDIETGFTKRATYWQRLLAVQPSSASYSANAVMRRAVDFYFMRLYITVTPTSVNVRPALESHPRTGKTTSAGTTVLNLTVAAFTRFDSAVLAGFGADGQIALVRTKPDASEIGLRIVTDADLTEGRASILCHRHDAKLATQESWVATGMISRETGGWLFTPERLIAGSRPGLAAQLSALRGIRRTARDYLAKRGLERPAIAWDELKRLKP